MTLTKRYCAYRYTTAQATPCKQMQKEKRMGIDPASLLLQ